MFGPSSAEEQRTRAHAAQLGLPYQLARSLVVNASAVAAVSEATIDRCAALPFAFQGECLMVATSDPQNLHALDDIALLSGHPVSAVVVSSSGVRWLIERHRRSSPDVHALQAALDEGDDASESQAAAIQAQTASVSDHAVVQVVDRILRDAIASGASDIHLEPHREGLWVRLRIDGQLRTRHELPVSSAEAIAARVKMLAHLDVAERRRPQDGRFTSHGDGHAVDLRVASLPTITGEKLVLRVLPRADSVPDLQELAFHDTNLTQLEQLLTQPHGLILITGPTGSGKTLSTFALLRRLATPERHVVTVEDPVEIELPGVVQTQVQPKAGYDFPNALRALLRHDPDVMVVGEVRDRETAQLAVEAALTGHTVIASLHTTDAPGALTRLRELGIEAFKLAASLQGVLAQRLLRRVCAHCAEERIATASERDWFAREGIPQSNLRLRRGRGCSACDGSGSAGRVAIHELLIATPAILAAIAQEQPPAVLRSVAEGSGMRSMRLDAASKAAAGLIPLEEVIAAAQPFVNPAHGAPLR